MQRGRAALVVCLLLASSFLIPGASAHISTGPISKTGVFELKAQGVFRDAFDQMFTDMGFVPFPGDVLRYVWTVSGGGVVTFNIHMHSPGGDVISFVLTTADSARGNWTIPGSDAYGAFWRNTSPVAVNVTYRYDLVPHPESEFLLLAVALGVSAGTLGLVFLTIVERRRERRHPPAPAARQDEHLDEADRP